MTEHTENREIWPKGVSNPAKRALQNAGITNVDDLAAWTEKDLLALHGMGPKAFGILKGAMADRNLNFREAVAL